MQPQRSPMPNLVGRRGWFYLFSLLILLPGAISLLIPPSLKTSIDFRGGTEFTARFQDPVEKDDLRDALADLGHDEARVQGTGQNEFLVRTNELQTVSGQVAGPTPPDEASAIRDGLIERFGPMIDLEGNEITGFLEIDSISATISREIARNAIIAVIAASVAIFLYLWWSFRSVPQSIRFGTAAIVALVHDALLVVGVFSILGKLIDVEIDKEFVVAILTVIGFSVHDSIVVFDRIRETVGRGESRTFADAVNASLLQTLSRSLNTSFTLVFALLALMLMGGESIREFLWAMLIGTIAGTYSSICIAAQILVSWDEGDAPRLFRRILGRPEPRRRSTSASR
ncbi:MAG: protein translocase subunit SecF [Chloroflexi bacterium]|nr:protein translocase subunit SecF [Chloroflexota bacterium]